MNDLVNTKITKNVKRAVVQHLIDNLLEINANLAEHCDVVNADPFLESDRIHAGKRLERNLRNFPATSVFSATRDNVWSASRTTEDTIGLNIFCGVMTHTDNDLLEDAMEDFADALFAVLFKNPKFTWTIVEDTVTVTYGIFDSKPVNIIYGSLDEGALKAAQITWTGRVWSTQSQSYTDI